MGLCQIRLLIDGQFKEEAGAVRIIEIFIS